MRRAPSTPPDLPGYRPLQLLGSGGFADVFLYEQRLPRRKVAVKVLLTEELGRAPSVSQVSGGRIPRLITIGAGDPDISRNHVRVAVEGDTVVVTDLHSRNGTHVVAPGKPPVKLRAGEPTPVLAGTVVDLGGGWTLQVVGA